LASQFERLPHTLVSSESLAFAPHE